MRVLFNCSLRSKHYVNLYFVERIGEIYEGQQKGGGEGMSEAKNTKRNNIRTLQARFKYYVISMVFICKMQKRILRHL